MKIKAETTNGGLIGIYVISNPRRVELVRDNAILDTPEFTKEAETIHELC